MKKTTTVKLIGRDEVILREVDVVDLAIPQYVNLSATQTEVYHFDGTDEQGTPIYRYVATNEHHVPKINPPRE